MTPGSDPSDVDWPSSRTPSSSEISSELIVRYLSGECTEAERATVEAWCASPATQPQDRVILDLPALLTTYARLTTAPVPASDALRRADTIMERAVLGGAPASESGTITARSESRRRIWQTKLPVRSWPRSITVGAAAMLAMLLVFVGWQVGTRASKTPRTGQVSSYTTAAGERTTIVLPDGSSVVLNVASRLDVPTDYAQGNRTLRLIGEAFFTVKHRDADPFVVISNASTTRVLGTKFAVRYYPTDSVVTVSVQEGKVAVGSTVVPAQRQVTVVAGVTSVLQPVDPGRFSFVSGILNLDGMLFREAIPELNRWYDADIRIGDESLMGLRIKGQLASRSLGDLTSILELNFDVHVVRDGRVLTLYPK